MNNNKYFLPINISIVTISDTRNLENDKSGDVLFQRVEKAGHKILSRKIVKDDFDEISELFNHLIKDKNIDKVFSFFKSIDYNLISDNKFNKTDYFFCNFNLNKIKI